VEGGSRRRAPGSDGAFLVASSGKSAVATGSPAAQSMRGWQRRPGIAEGGVQEVSGGSSSPGGTAATAKWDPDGPIAVEGRPARRRVADGPRDASGRSLESH
jgi:hypothetical protein